MGILLVFIQTYVVIYFYLAIISIILSLFGIQTNLLRTYGKFLVYLARFVFNVKTKTGEEALKQLNFNSKSTAKPDTIINEHSNIELYKPLECEMESFGFIRQQHRVKRISVLSNPSRASFESSGNISDNEEFKCESFLSINSGSITEVTRCISAIVDDSVTKCFEAQNLASWNLLSRSNLNSTFSKHFSETNSNYNWTNTKIYSFYWLGFFIRYFVVFPYRLAMLISAFICLLSTAMILKFQLFQTCFPKYYSNPLNNYNLRQKCNKFIMSIFLKCSGLIINIHNKRNTPKDGSICIANHTSVLDIFVLNSQRTYSTIGKKHPGIIGAYQNLIDNLTNNIWFDTSDENDRLLVPRLMKNHLKEEPKLDPIMIFPEGTCINNTSVMMFKKGSFELDAIFYPVAIKYNPYFGDMFWNSSKYSMAHYVFKIFTAWCLLADVYYMPPMTKFQNETAQQFSNRCKSKIANQICLTNLKWDGGLKRKTIKRSTEIDKSRSVIYKELEPTFKKQLEKVEKIENESSDIFYDGTSVEKNDGESLSKDGLLRLRKNKIVSFK